MADTWTAISGVFFLAALLATRIAAVELEDGAVTNTFLSPDPGVLVPIKFNQSLLVCNAYPSGSSISVKKNGEALTTENDELSFRECRDMKTSVHSHDKLDFMVVAGELHGTFEVGDLPSSDATLLLVVNRHARTSMVSFQSFAFPSIAENNKSEARLAIIDAYRGNTSSPNLKVQDDLGGNESKNGTRHVEQLKFDHVYAIEEGMYDASITDRMFDQKDEAQLAKSTQRKIKLSGSKNYVVLRTGDAEHFPQSLLVYPDDMAFTKNLAQQIGLAWSITGLAAAAALTQAFARLSTVANN